MFSLPSFLQIWAIKRNLYSVEVIKYKMFCITIYLKSKQNGNEYTKFSECVVRKVSQWRTATNTNWPPFLVRVSSLKAKQSSP